jgi:hypothetical protein
MKNISRFIQIAGVIFFFNLIRNTLSYFAETKGILPKEKTLPFFVNGNDLLYMFITFTVTIILARFLIDKPTIFARNLFIIIQLSFLTYSFYIAYLGLIAASGASEIVIQICGLFLAITFINSIFTSVLIYLGYRFVRDSNLISNSVVGRLN